MVQWCMDSFYKRSFEPCIFIFFDETSRINLVNRLMKVSADRCFRWYLKTQRYRNCVKEEVYTTLLATFSVQYTLHSVQCTPSKKGKIYCLGRLVRKLFCGPLLLIKDSRKHFCSKENTKKRSSAFFPPKQHSLFRSEPAVCWQVIYIFYFWNISVLEGLSMRLYGSVLS